MAKRPIPDKIEGLFPRFFYWLFGPNWKTSATAAGSSVLYFMGFLSSLPYEAGPISNILPPSVKFWFGLLCGGSGAFLQWRNGHHQKSKEVTGGSIEQSADTKTIVSIDHKKPKRTEP